MNEHNTITTPQQGRLRWAGYLLGFSFGGFFDGILLHQVLQWHHLLSGVGRAPFDDLRVQILADGLFHAAMYVVALAGIWKLLQARHALVDRLSERQLAADLLIGFGTWHVVDAVLSHWLLGIHRIRMDVPDPIVWDMLWFVLFGVLFIAAGILLRRRPPRHGDEARGKAHSVLTLIAGALLAALISSSGPGANPNMVTVLLRPGVPPAQLLAGLQEVDGKIVWNNPQGDVWVFAVDRHANPSRLYAHGAMLVSGTLLPAGCSAWLRT